MADNKIPEPLSFNTEWFRTRYYIENGRILPIPGAAGEYYNPFDHYDSENGGIPGESLHIQFANWDFSNDKGVEEFCNTWGVLGLGKRSPLFPGIAISLKERYRVKPVIDIPNDEHRARLEPWHYIAEPVDEFIKEAVFFKWAVLAGNALKEDNIQEQERLLAEITKATKMVSCSSGQQVRMYGYDGSTPLPPWGCDLFILMEWLEHDNLSSKEQLELGFNELISTCLQYIHPVMTRGFVLKWQFPSLLDALYMMLALDYQKERFIRVCKSTTCNKVFATDRGDRIFCSRKCAKRQADRDYRERERKKKQKGGRN